MRFVALLTIELKAGTRRMAEVIAEDVGSFANCCMGVLHVKAQVREMREGEEGEA